jgi:hypothetical protein
VSPRPDLVSNACENAPAEAFFTRGSENTSHPLERDPFESRAKDILSSRDAFEG